MPRDDDHAGGSGPLPSRERDRVALRRSRATLAVAGLALLVTLFLLYRMVTVSPTAAQAILVARGGEVTSVLRPGQTAWLNPWTHSSVAYDTALLASDRSAANAGMPAVSAEGHGLTVFGTAFWREGEEADLRWRFAHIHPRTDLLPGLMAASVQAAAGRRPMDDLIRDTPGFQAALTEELRARARALLRIEVVDFAVTRLDPGESYRQIVLEREMGRARAASIAASPALSGGNPNAVEVERIRRWDGRGIIPGQPERDAGR